MPTPAFFPEVDTNKTRQPADPAGIPQAIKDDGFRENEVVPNTFWNWLFSLLNDWLVFLGGSRLLASFSVLALSASVLPATSLTHTLPANIVKINTTVIRMRGTWKITGESAATSGQIQVQVGDAVATIYTALLATVLINKMVHLEVELIASAGQLNYSVRDYRDGGASTPVVVLDRGSTAFDPSLTGTYQFVVDLPAGDALDFITCINQTIEIEQR